MLHADEGAGFVPVLSRVELAEECTLDESEVRREFPTVELSRATNFDRSASVDLDAWARGVFDGWQFDRALDRLVDGGEPFRVVSPGGEERTATLIALLSRAQRRIARTNSASRAPVFAQIRALHRAMHPLEKALAQADYDHALDAWQWTLRLAPDVTLDVQLAALLHDIERLVSEVDARIEQYAPDYRKFKEAHASAGATLAAALLERAGADPDLRERAVRLVAESETKSPDVDVQIVNDADSLSFFSLNASGYLDYYGAEQTEIKIRYTLERMSSRAREHLARVALRADFAALYREVRHAFDGGHA